MGNRFWFELAREVRVSEGSSFRESTVHQGDVLILT